MTRATTSPMPMTRPAAASTDLLVGVGAGLVAGLAMNLFQKAWMAIADKPEPKETAASKAADAVSEETSGSPVKSSRKKSADTFIHYATAAALGGAYGLLGGMFPRLFMGRGLLFGVGAWLIADEMAVPALKLAPSPAKTKLPDHALGLCSHLVFGAVLDLARRRINALISSETHPPAEVSGNVPITHSSWVHQAGARIFP